MFKAIKNLFTGKKEAEVQTDPPGRTFKRILTGEYFACEAPEADEDVIEKSKHSKIEQIRSLELEPKFVRFTYKKDKVVSAHVAFQKEVFAKKWNMIHISEISFIVREQNFEEFEKMAGVSLKDDFNDLTEVEYRGEERRKEERSSEKVL